MRPLAQPFVDGTRTWRSQFTRIHKTGHCSDRRIDQEHQLKHKILHSPVSWMQHVGGNIRRSSPGSQHTRFVERVDSWWGCEGLPTRRRDCLKVKYTKSTRGWCKVSSNSTDCYSHMNCEKLFVVCFPMRKYKHTCHTVLQVYKKWANVHIG